MLAARGLTDDLRISPAEPAEMHSHRDASQTRSRRGTAAFADRNIVGDVEPQWYQRPARGRQHFAISVEDKVVLELATDFTTAAGGGNGKLLSWTGINPDVEIHRQRGGVKGRTEIGGRRRQR